MISSPTRASLPVCRICLGRTLLAGAPIFFAKCPGTANAWRGIRTPAIGHSPPVRPSPAGLLSTTPTPKMHACAFLAGSHHHGHLTWRKSSPEEHNTLNQSVENAEQYGTPVDNVLRAGECSLHTDLLLHGSEANASRPPPLWAHPPLHHSRRPCRHGLEPERCPDQRLRSRRTLGQLTEA